MTLPKPWPKSGSEFELNAVEVQHVEHHLLTCVQEHCGWRYTLAYHDIACMATLDMADAYERYCTAAGFRED
jgi:hypothetical protein